jgi:hypothetical protein
VDCRTPQGNLITRWEEWTRPKRDYQWKEGRSAMELAKAWFRTGRLAVPTELNGLFRSEVRFEGLTFQHAVPELITRLPERGEGRNHDLWLLGQTRREQVTVCVEAKADEPFGDNTVGSYLAHCLRRRRRGISTRAPERIAALLQMVDPERSNAGHSPWNHIQYQLLTAVCGTRLQTQIDCSHVGILLVHVFETDATTPQKLEINADAFAEFVSVLTTTPAHLVRPEQLYGPTVVDGVDLYVGKVVAQV